MNKKSANFRNFLFATTLAFAVLAFFSKQYQYFSIDLVITQFIQRINVFGFDELMRFVTFLGNAEGMTVIVVLLSIYGFVIGKRHAPLLLLVSTVGGVLLSYLFKVIILRPRPDPLLIHQVGNFVWSDSFPSGHVMGAISLYGFLLYIVYSQLKPGFLRKMVIGICVVMIVLMGISRIYLGAHWFSDVLGAYLIGFVWLSVVVFTYHKMRPNQKKL